ncbi:ParA family protein [Rickettsiales endosymbiont of Paramecium tredecaurelia]|uniref:ParA family protein n=1 Tax=Candidatus Sarmatiella mevalonica TaxID=2770581 RepID=UPI001921B9B2|nr:AAA family ATPase [Candidatus Sarmatiella mevalonica]MBL3284623.1 ParA family protein [Candidatus Sarmatiella mevalonica]
MNDTRKTKVLSVVNQKGGVGKTTTAINLSTAFSIMGKKTLVIDLDPQGNASSGFGIEKRSRLSTIYHALAGLERISETIIKTNVNNLCVISSNTNLAGAEIELIQLKQREFVLRNLLDQIIHAFDYVIIDCPPSLNLLTINALTASNGVLIPMQCDFFSLEGLTHLLSTIEFVQKKLNQEIKISGILFTMYDKRNKLTEAVEKDVRDYLGDLVYSTTIPRNIKLSEAPSYGEPGVIYDHKCPGSVAYLALTKEILARE